MIEMNHVYKTYTGPVHALRGINLNIEKGEFVFLTGPSGAGKTTLFRMLSGFARPTTGSVSVVGYNLTHMADSEIPQMRRRIGVVFQDFKLLSERSIFENVALPLRVVGEKDSFIRKRVYEVLELVGLIDKVNTCVSFLSGGEQQRVAIARAIIHRPGLLIADEPTGNLDPKLGQEIMALFNMVNEQGTTVVIATHDYSFFEKYKKRRIEMEHGQIVRDGYGLAEKSTSTI